MNVYLDHHSATYVHPQVVDAMMPYLKSNWGNYLQPHQRGQELHKAISSAYETIYATLGADPKEDHILFVSSRAEAISTAFHIAYLEAFQKQGKNQFIALATDDAPILMNLKKYESLGTKTVHLELHPTALIDVDKIAESITPRTAMISLSLAHGLLGVVQPIEKLKELCALRGIYLHLDVSYAIGKMEVDLGELGADFITFGGDAIEGPKSSGVLYVNPSIAIHPLICGGLEQRGYRGGTLDVAQLVGLSKACELAQENIAMMGLEVASLRDLFEKEITEHLEEAEVLFNNRLRLPNVSVIAFKREVSDALLYLLDQRGVLASLGGVHFQRLQNLLSALGYASEVANGALSFAFSSETTAAEVKEAASIIIEEVKKMRTLSKEVFYAT